jgi:hypothetical protein
LGQIVAPCWNTLLIATANVGGTGVARAIAGVPDRFSRRCTEAGGHPVQFVSSISALHVDERHRPIVFRRDGRIPTYPARQHAGNIKNGSALNAESPRPAVACVRASRRRLEGAAGAAASIE